MQIVVIAHNIRSLYNLGSMFRTTEGFGVSKVYLSGYTAELTDALPHIRDKNLKQLHKTALGAEDLVPYENSKNIELLISSLKEQGFRIVGLEQDPRSQVLDEYIPSDKLALLLGEEVQGITPDLRGLCDDLIEIPMRGQKESFNVSVATGIALYALSR